MVFGHVRQFLDYISVILHYSVESRYQLDWNLLIQHSFTLFFAKIFSQLWATLQPYHIDKKSLSNKKNDRKSDIQIMVCLEPD